MANRKVVLFIVEGKSDENALSLIITKLVSKNLVKFHVVRGDVTSQFGTTTQNCIEKVNKEIEKFIEEYKLEKKDILKIIHLVDTDGAYVDDIYVKYHDSDSSFYKSDGIYTSKIDDMKRRNKQKSAILNKLYTTPKISGIEYTMYYFSCNLDHVLHDEQNLSDELKCEYADNFQMDYYDREEDFKEFIMNSVFSVVGDYKESWEFIKINNNSLNRYSNFGLFFKE